MHPRSRILMLCALVIAYLVGLAVGQASVSPTATSSGAAQTYTIAVGNGDHKFRPDVVQAEIGDYIEFNFYPKNHSVVRAEYQYPCIPYEMTGKGKVGFFSGFHPVDAVLSNPPKWRVRINDTNPIFFYCSAPGSCINYGMVGVINPNASVSLDNQRNLAEDSAYMLQPGEPFPAEGGTSTTSSTTATSSPSTTLQTSTTATSAAAATTSAAAAVTSHGGLSTGAIAGIVVGVVLIIALAAALFFYIGRSKTLKEEVQRVSVRESQLPGSLYPHNSFFSDKNAVMNDNASRYSGAMSPQHPPYEYTSHAAPVVTDTKPDPYVITTSEVSSHPHATMSATSDGPVRHPSVLLNPNHPQEMGANYNRF